jgi:hypothetical protein
MFNIDPSKAYADEVIRQHNHKLVNSLQIPPTDGADGELREKILNHISRYGIALEWQDLKEATNDERRQYVAPIADYVLALVQSHTAKAVLDAENYGRIASLLDFITWVQLHEVKDIVELQDYVQHVKTSILQTPDQRYIPWPEVKAALQQRQKGDSDAK